MNPIAFYILLALVAGACLPTQAGINVHLGLWTRSSVLAAAISFAVGTLALIAYALGTRIPLPAAEGLAGRPWWIWSGGVLGAFFVTATVILAPRLGAAAMLALIIAGQMVASLLLDHFGLLGYAVHPVNGWRMLGVALLVAGVVLIRRF
ncbi:MAG: DMT family transporter [Desulfobacterales bacterium]|nr:DMT family transporter [Desulfobacterales bacterium]